MSEEILLIGDLHIPTEAEKVPEKFLKAAQDSDLILCTGDLVEENVLEKLEDCGDVRIVKGDNDYLELPEQDVVDVELMKFGLIHGHQLEENEEEKDKRINEEEEEKGEIEKLVDFGKVMQVDVLVTGHTHKPFRTEREGVVLMNPGTATGVSEEGKTKKTCIKLRVEERDIVESNILKA